MNLQSYLDESGVHYHLSYHPAAYTAQDLAAAEHIPGRRVVKHVLVQADGHFVLCALPAPYKIDLQELRAQLECASVQLADEHHLASLFPDCQLGTVPPLGPAYGLQTLIEESLLKLDQVTFQAGSHDAAITLSLADYRRLSQAEVAHFGRPVV